MGNYLKGFVYRYSRDITGCTSRGIAEGIFEGVLWGISVKISEKLYGIVVEKSLKEFLRESLA